MLGRRRIITGSYDGLLRLLDHSIVSKLEHCCERKRGWKVRLWYVERGKVITKWTGDIWSVESVWWIADHGESAPSGSRDSGTARARVRDVQSGEVVMAIKTRHASLGDLDSTPPNKDCKRMERVSS